MNGDTAIEISNVTKRFNLSQGAGISLKHRAMDLLLRRKSKTFTALRDVNFDVKKGETLGIIGCNGAGKSTLLSIIAGTMSPTEGKVRTKGKISSLLELGAGFHPDLTGRENVFLYGSIMDIPRAVMQKRFDSIVDFAGIGQFIDQPVRFYSSGMYVRLGFSVAVQIDPDILLVDEVLAVGDVDFQKRCLEKMSEFQKAGKTLLLISHDLGTMHKISNRIAILNHGTIEDIGDPAKMIDKYRDSLFSNMAMPQVKGEWGTREAVLEKITLLDDFGNETRTVTKNGHLRIRIEYKASRTIETPIFGFRIKQKDHDTVFASNTDLESFPISSISEGNGVLNLEIDCSQLQFGEYVMSFSLHSNDHSINYHRIDESIPFYIAKPHHPCEGIVALPTKFYFD